MKTLRLEEYQETDSCHYWLVIILRQSYDKSFDEHKITLKFIKAVHNISFHTPGRKRWPTDAPPILSFLKPIENGNISSCRKEVIYPVKSRPSVVNFVNCCSIWDGLSMDHRVHSKFSLMLEIFNKINKFWILVGKFCENKKKTRILFGNQK